MTIKELRENIDKIDDNNLEYLLKDLFDYGNRGIFDFNEALEIFDIEDFISIPYELVEESEE